MTIYLTALSGAQRGEPITTTRHYLELPLGPRTLLEHYRSLAGEELRIVTNHDFELPVIGPETFAKQLTNKDIIIPGDLYIDSLPPAGSIVTGDSEEEAAVKHLRRITHQSVRGRRVNYPWELLNVTTHVLATMERRLKGEVHETAVLKGIVHIGKGSVVEAGSVIEGPVVIGNDCVVGPMAHLRPGTVLCDGARVGKTEVVESVLLDGATTKHHAYLGYSVVGAGANIAAGTITADYRHDAGEHTTLVAGDRVATGRKKLGAFLGDRVHTGIHTSLYPGRKLWPGTTTLPGEVVTHDKER